MATLETPPTELLLADAAFRRDLPSLLAAHRGQFVAYLGSQRVAIDDSPFALEDRCHEFLPNTWMIGYVGESDDSVETTSGFWR